MNTYRKFLFTAIGVLFFGLVFFFSVFWIAYGWAEATDSFLSMIIAISITVLVIPLFYRGRLKYLDSEELISPAFRDTSFREFGIDVNRFDFEYFKQLIEKSFVISVRSDNTLKFRRKFNFWSWGAGAFLQYNRDAGKVKIDYFPISGYTRHGTKAVRKMDKALEELICPSLKS